MRACTALVIFATLTLGGAAPALAASPYVEVAPSQVANGQTANVYGTGFCPSSSGCSTVSIAVEQQQVATGVTVGSDGKFHAAFPVSEFPGSYHVTASQKAADGSTIQAVTGMTVQLQDNRTSPPPTVVKPPTSQPGSSPTPNPGAAAAPSSSPDASPTPQPETTKGGPLSPATAAVNGPTAFWLPLVLLLLVVVGAALAWIAWRRRREST